MSAANVAAVAAALGSPWTLEPDTEGRRQTRFVNAPEQIAVWFWSDGEREWTAAGKGRLTFHADTADESFRKERGQLYYRALTLPREITVAADRPAEKIAAEIKRRLLPGCFELLKALRGYRAAATEYTRATNEIALACLAAWPAFGSPRMEHGAGGYTSAKLYGGPVDVDVTGTNATFKIRTEGTAEARAVMLALAAALKAGA